MAEVKNAVGIISKQEARGSLRMVLRKYLRSGLTKPFLTCNQSEALAQRVRAAELDLTQY